MATKELKVGDKVSWNSAQGKVIGSVKKKLTAPTDIKTHPVAASPEPPRISRRPFGLSQAATVVT